MAYRERYRGLGKSKKLLVNERRTFWSLFFVAFYKEAAHKNVRGKKSYVSEF